MRNHKNSEYNAASSRIGWAFFLNTGFTIVEFVGGWLTNSTAIMADALHDLGDSLSIGLAWILNKFSIKRPNDNFSYGYQRFSLLGALFTGVALIGGSIWILTQAIPRLFNPEMPDAKGMILLSILGIFINGLAIYKLRQGKSLNERILNWHLLEDVLGWVAVLLVAIALLFFDVAILDPILSIGFTLFILFNVIKNLRETITVFLQATPNKTMRTKIIAELEALTNIRSIHHAHLWSLDGNDHVFTAHLVLERSIAPSAQAQIKREISALLTHYDLLHTTIELELPGETCRDK